VQSDETTKKLFALFAMHRFVFVGFSLSDPDLMEILREVNAHLGAREPRHFALIGVREDEDRVIARDRLVLKFGVAPIFFDVTHDFEGLPTLVRALAARCYGVEAVPEPLEALRESAAIDVSQRAPGFGYPEETDFSPEQRVVERRFRGSEPPDLLSNAPAFAPPPQAPAPAPAEEPAPPVDPDDPHKGQFGWEAERDGRALRGCVERTDDPYWFRVELEVTSTAPAAPLAGPVTFHLHPTFSPDEVEMEPEDGTARLRINSYGAFTVGAETADGTRLELCLASIPDAPIEFRMR
jgi:hypothetical protein